MYTLTGENFIAFIELYGFPWTEFSAPLTYPESC
jgi:hypothetical protein